MNLLNIPTLLYRFTLVFTYVGIVLVSMYLSNASAQRGAEISITRDDQTIVIKQADEATSDSGARFIPPRAKDCEEGLRLGSFYAPGDYRVSTTINNSLLLSNIVLVKVPASRSKSTSLSKTYRRRNRYPWF